MSWFQLETRGDRQNHMKTAQLEPKNAIRHLELTKGSSPQQWMGKGKRRCAESEPTG